MRKLNLTGNYNIAFNVIVKRQLLIRDEQLFYQMDQMFSTWEDIIYIPFGNWPNYILVFELITIRHICGFWNWWVVYIEWNFIGSWCIISWKYGRWKKKKSWNFTDISSRSNLIMIHKKKSLNFVYVFVFIFASVFFLHLLKQLIILIKICSVLL